MNKAKFEGSKEIKQKLDNKDELSAKEKELKNREERLESIPKDMELTKGYYEDMMAREKVKIDYINLWLTNLKPLQPKYSIELSSIWADIRKRELTLELSMVKKNIESLESQASKAIKDLNAQESRCKEDIPKIKKQIHDLKELLKAIK